MIQKKLKIQNWSNLKLQFKTELTKMMKRTSRREKETRFEGNTQFTKTK